MKKTTSLIVAALVAFCAAAGVAFWLLSSGAPSYDKICRMNDDLKQARQLGLSTREKYAERLGSAILKTTDESLLADLLANVSFEDRFARAILDKIKTPETIEAVARAFKAEILADGSNGQGSPTLYDAILDRLPDDNAVERVVGFRLGEFDDDPDTRTNTRGKDDAIAVREYLPVEPDSFEEEVDRILEDAIARMSPEARPASGKSDLAASLVRRILAMDDKERAESLLEKMAEKGVFRVMSSDARLEIALRTKNENIRRATGVDQDMLDLGDLVAKWDPDCLSRPVREIMKRGWEIKDAQKFVKIIERFDPDFQSNDLEKWEEYANSVQPLLAAIDRLSANASANSPESDRRSRLVEKRDKAQAAFKECKKVIDEVRVAVDANDFATIMAACEFAGVYFDASDPEDTGWRLGNKLRQLYQQTENEKEAAEKELAAQDRVLSSQREKNNGEIAKLKTQLEQIRQRHETPEIRKKREVREKTERDRLAANAKTISVSDQVSIGLQSVPGDLWFGKTEVTQAQWEAVMCENPSRFKNPDNPVENVSWYDCQEFLKILNTLPSVKKSGVTFRLPTEEEWEYACRAGATGDYCKLANGTEITKDTLGQVAWFDNNSDRKTNPVGQKKPNAWGLYDMHGNVWEWTSTADGEDRVRRGGCWDNSARYCESSHRFGNSPSYRDCYLGFRLCASGSAD